MSVRAHYFRVGVFVLIGMGLIVAAAIVFGVGTLSPEDLFYAETYLSSSVQGLEVGSPVKLQGVQVGRVELITFADKIYEIDPAQLLRGRLVLVRMALTRDAMISRTDEQFADFGKRMTDAGLRVRLASSGFTGIRYMEAEMLNPERYPPMQIDWEPEVLYVPSAPGVFSEIVDSIDALTMKLESIPFDKLSSEAEKLVHTLHTGVEDADIATLSGKAQRLLDNLQQATGPELLRVELSKKYGLDFPDYNPFAKQPRKPNAKRPRQQAIAVDPKAAARGTLRLPGPGWLGAVGGYGAARHRRARRRRGHGLSEHHSAGKRGAPASLARPYPI